MNFEDLIKKVSNLPCFTVGFLTAGRNPAKIRPQISRWVKDHKLIKLHKGLYVLAKPWRKSPLERFAIANKLKIPSYVSLQSALAFHGMIPEYVPQVTSVTTSRPGTLQTPLGRFDFRHIGKNRFFGFKKTQLAEGQTAFIAGPEKALLDLVYLTPKSDSTEYIVQLRLQNLAKLNRRTLWDTAKKANSPKLERACRIIETIINQGEGVEL